MLFALFLVFNRPISSRGRVNEVLDRTSVNIYRLAMYKDGSILARVELILTVVRSYLTGMNSHGEISRSNKYIH